MTEFQFGLRPEIGGSALWLLLSHRGWDIRVENDLFPEPLPQPFDVVQVRGIRGQKHEMELGMLG